MQKHIDRVDNLEKKVEEMELQANQTTGTVSADKYEALLDRVEKLESLFEMQAKK
ncbi:MAG: hypothetical protein AAF573_13255 [Bacteroidota bacterium]